MNLIRKVCLFLKKIKPRYQLSLDSNFYDLASKKVVYRFKIFGEHTFPKFTYDDITNDKQLMFDVNPSDLMKIAVDNYVDSQRKSMLFIKEFLRDNKYMLSNNEADRIFSGDEICENILLIEKIKNIDLYKIVYNTGFNHGKHLAREIIKQAEPNNSYHENIIDLKMIIDEKQKKV